MTGQNQPAPIEPSDNNPHRQPVTPGRSWSNIAAESGMTYIGEAKDAPAVEPGPLADTSDDQTGDDAGQDEPSAVDADSDAASEEAEGDDESLDAADDGTATPAAPDGNDGEEGEVASIGELVETSEIDPEWFQGLGVDVTVNGETSQVPFRELVANYQMNQAADAKLEQAKTKASEAQAEIAQKNAALEAQFQTAGAIIQQAEKILQADFEAVDWKALHEEDPGEWSAQKMAFNERNQQVAALKQGLIQQYQQSVQERQAEQAQQQQEFLQEQVQLLQQEMPKVSPDWGKPETQPAAKARLSDFLLRQGFTQEDINTAADHRLLLIAEKARLYDEGKGKIEVSKKRLRKVPKVVKPGTPKPAGQVQSEQLKTARNRLAQSGHLEDAMAVLRAKRKAG